MNTKQIHELIVQTANAGCHIQRPDGAMPPGANGPHQHKMTPARNTSHWSITFLWAYRTTQSDRFRTAATKALDLLISPRLRPMNGAFWHRCHPERNSFNGLIGQSWTMEALYYGTLVLGEPKYREIALQVYRQHRFDRDTGLWWQLKLDGSPGNIETTLNQQIWFAAIGGLLSEHSCGDIDNELGTFLSKLPNHINLRRFGLLRNFIMKPGIRPVLKWQLYRNMKYRFRPPSVDAIQSAYHVFSLCGLAHLVRSVPDHSFWNSEPMDMMLRFLFTSRFRKMIQNNPYGFPYNVIGFEVPFILQAFRHKVEKWCDIRSISQEYIHRQIDDHYDQDTSLMRRNTKDEETLAARFYEICRIDIENYQ